MNYIKLQQELLKKFAKNQLAFTSYARTEEEIFLTDGKVAYYIPICYWVINAEALGLKTISSSLPELMKKRSLNHLHYKYDIKEGKYTLICFESSEDNTDFQVFVDKKLFDTVVDKYDEYLITCDGYSKPVFCTNPNTDEVVAVIMPVLRRQV